MKLCNFGENISIITLLT